MSEPSGALEYVGLPQRPPRPKRRRLLARQQVECDAEPVQAEEPAGAADGDGTTEFKAPDALPELEAYRSAAEGDYKFEYLDHTADVQLHAWGKTLEEAFENAALCMFNYMTPLEGIVIDDGLTRCDRRAWASRRGRQRRSLQLPQPVPVPHKHRRYEAEGHDLQSLLFAFLDEMLFGFGTEFFVCKEIRILELDRSAWKITAEGRGQMFDRETHVCGTEIKAITYSAMQINESEGDSEVFVIVDI